jgi:phage-related protein
MKTIIVNFYKSEKGNEPVREWLKSLSKEDKTIIGEDIKTVEYGWPLGMPLVRKMDKNLWEVRIDLTKNEIARILFTVSGDIMVLLHGFIKKSQQTPTKDLKIAKERRDRVLNS